MMNLLAGFLANLKGLENIISNQVTGTILYKSDGARAEVLKCKQ